MSFQTESCTSCSVGGQWHFLSAKLIMRQTFVPVDFIHLLWGMTMCLRLEGYFSVGVLLFPVSVLVPVPLGFKTVIETVILWFRCFQFWN